MNMLITLLNTKLNFSKIICVLNLVKQILNFVPEITILQISHSGSLSQNY